MASLDAVALFGAAAAVVVAWRGFRTSIQGGAYYDREVYGMTPAAHRRIGIAGTITAIVCLLVTPLHGTPITIIVAIESLAAILYLASFARGASFEGDD